MNKELQDLVWSILPKEFKEEVKYEYRRVATKASKEEYDLGFMHAHEGMFGIHNLTSDTEGEEMLTVSRKKVQEKWQRAYEQEAKYSEAEQNPTAREELYYNRGIISVIDTLFGSKCLPDEPSKLQASCGQVNVDSSHGNVDSLEPKPAEPNPDGDNLSPEPQPANRTPSSYTQPVTDCHHTDRLRIAAMAMQALLSNADRMKMYEDLASDPLSDNLTRIVARNALRYADALVAETQQGGEKMKKQKENRNVCIRWVDSGMDSGWRDISDGFKASEIAVESFGIIIYEDDKVIGLAHNYSDETDNSATQVNGIMTIPKCCIKEIITLTV